MELSQLALLRLYLLAVLLGVFLGVIYDILRISRVFLGVRYSRRAFRSLYEKKLPYIKMSGERRESPFLGTLIFFEDLFFGVFCGVSTILLFYAANNGNFRFLVLVCILGGFFLYRGTIGRPIMLASELIAYGVEAVFRYAVFIGWLPVRILIKCLGVTVGRLWVTLQSALQRRDRRRYTKRQKKINERCAGGLIPQDNQNKRIFKRRRYHASNTKKTVQLEHAGENFSRGHRCRFRGRVCKQCHEVQSAHGGAERTRTTRERA